MLGCSKEPSHREGSFEYPQHMFRLKIKKNNFQLRILIWGTGLLILKGLHFCYDKMDLQRKIYNFFFLGGGGIIICDLSIFSMNHPVLTVSIFMENFTGPERVYKCNCTIQHLSQSMRFLYVLLLSTGFFKHACAAIW